jgi:hypothetical protein
MVSDVSVFCRYCPLSEVEVMFITFRRPAIYSSSVQHIKLVRKFTVMPVNQSQLLLLGQPDPA